MIERKPDAARIEAHLDALRKSDWIGPARQWWPKYVFRFDDIQNAVRILSAGKLTCRSNRGEAVETASKAVLDKTDEKWKEHVRLYFRPRTPTQYQVEGFRPKGQWGSLQAHMPMPIFFLFDAKEILTRRTTQFSYGNLAAHPVVADDAGFFESIPFEMVYHDSPMPEDVKSTIKFHRQAEVVVPGELDLESLRHIWCRSQAEHQTLMNLLPAQIVKKYAVRMNQGKRPNLHFYKWTFVEQVTLEQSKISFAFNTSTLTPGPFLAHLEVTNRRTGEKYKWENAQFHAKDPLIVGVPQLDKPTAYDARFTLDGAITFAGRFTPKTIPF
jgi:hypothetical protein